MKLPRVSALAALSTAAGLVYLYAAAARWRDLHLLACRRIAELERILAHDRRVSDMMLDELTAELRKLRAENSGLVNLSREALRMAADRIDALTEEVRAQRGHRDMVRVDVGISIDRASAERRYHAERIAAAESSTRGICEIICPTCHAVDVPCFSGLEASHA